VRFAWLIPVREIRVTGAGRQKENAIKTAIRSCILRKESTVLIVIPSPAKDSCSQTPATGKIWHEYERKLKQYKKRGYPKIYQNRETALDLFKIRRNNMRSPKFLFHLGGT
jgi:hypothetical protein